jgi:hypothetical protein
MRASLKTKLFALWCVSGFLMLGAGCTTIHVQKIPPQDGIYPGKIAPDAPLVLAIPGLVVPGLRVTQEQHFGYLVEMLAAEGIPCRILYYNTPDDPVARKAALFSPDLSIAQTRVGPAVIRELELENERRDSFGMPHVKKLVLFGYSQGGVIMAQIGRRIFFSFKEEYEELVKQFGGEWQALQNDPEFVNFINALDDFVAIRNIRVQYEGLFKRSPALRRFYDRAERRTEKQFEDLLLYLVDPSSRFPNIKHFETPESPYYPKRYEKIREYAAARRSRSAEEREKNLQFFTTYAQYRSLLNVEPYFITASASLFGSPEANDTFTLMKLLPFLRPIIGREYYQIKQTELGTTQQIAAIETLVREKKDKNYPLNSSHILFILGANGEKGDGLVDQPAAHLSEHFYARLKAVDDSATGSKLVTVERDTLPPLVVVPLEVMHFPEKVMWGLGGTRYGSAYMVPGNPSFPYLLDYIKGDWQTIEKKLGRSDILLSQFMVQISFTDAKMRRSSAWREGQSDNVWITGHYFNRDSGTVIWTGCFEEKGILAELQERARLLNPVPLIPGLRDLLGREGAPANLGPLERLKKSSELLNPIPLIPGARNALGMTGIINEVELAREDEGRGRVHIQVRLPDGKKVPLTCAVYPGAISFYRIETSGENHLP